MKCIEAQHCTLNVLRLFFYEELKRGQFKVIVYSYGSPRGLVWDLISNGR